MSRVRYPDFFFKSKFAMECTCCSFRVPFALRIPPPMAYQSYTSNHLRTKIHFPDALKSTAADGLHTEERDHNPVLLKLQRDTRHFYPGNYPFKTHLRSGISSAQHCCYAGCLSSYSTSRALPQPAFTSIYPRTFSAQRVDIPFSSNEGTRKALAFPVQRMSSSWNSDQIPRVNNNRQMLLNGGEPSAFSRASSRGRRYSRHQNAWGGPTYTELITKAILSTPECRMTLASIYEWISDHVPYFAERRECKTSEGWKNAIRHTLSLRKRFIRVPKTDGGATSWYSSWWTVSEQYLTKQSTLSGETTTIKGRDFVFSSFQPLRITKGIKPVETSFPESCSKE